MIEITDKSEPIEILNKTVVDFYSNNCGPCRKMIPVLEELEKEFTDVKFYKVNAVENPELAKKLKVCGLPTIIILDNGKTTRFVGLTPKISLINCLESKNA